MFKKAATAVESDYSYANFCVEYDVGMSMNRWSFHFCCKKRLVSTLRSHTEEPRLTFYDCLLFRFAAQRKKSTPLRKTWVQRTTSRALIPQMSGRLSLRRSCAHVSPLFCSLARFLPKPQTDNITNNNITQSRSPLGVAYAVHEVWRISHSCSFTERCFVEAGEYGTTREMLHTTVTTGQRSRRVFGLLRRPTASNQAVWGTWNLVIITITTNHSNYHHHHYHPHWRQHHYHLHDLHLFGRKIL